MERSELQAILDEVIAAFRRGDSEGADQLWRDAQALSPKSASLYAVRGWMLALMRRFDEATSAYQQAISLDPDLVEARRDLAILLGAAGHAEDALVQLDQVLDRQPTSVDTHRRRILMLAELGRHEAALTAAAMAISRCPEFVDLLVARAAAERLAGDYETSMATIAEALQRSPEHARAWAEKGSTLHAVGRLPEALDAFDEALGFEETVFALNGIGLVELDMSMGKAALAAFNRALELDADNFDARFYRAQTLETLGHFEEALAAYSDVLARRPNHAPAYNNIGKIKRDMGIVDDALVAFRRAVELDPSNAQIFSNLLLTLLYDPQQKPEDLAAEHRAFGQRYGQSNARFMTWSNAIVSDKPLKIGVVSAEFRRHALNSWLLASLQGLDRRSLSLFCYSTCAFEDDVTPQFKELADHWRSVVGLDDRYMAELVRADGIDILVDISGHSAFNRLDCFALKPAPVQASWLGYPFTTGLEEIDFVIMDDVVVRPGEEPLFTEAVVRLTPSRFCCQPPKAAPDVVAPPALRNGWITFGSFNNIAKLTPEVIELWCALLHRLPTSRLVLKSPAFSDLAVARRMRETICDTGLTSARFELRPGSTYNLMLAEYGDIDIALDPFPFGGGVTSSEALWMGVPIVTLPSWHPASRQTASILHAIGREEWVAQDQAGYLALAIELATDSARLADYRESQRTTFAQSALCDKRTFGVQLNSALRAMWETYCSQSRALPEASMEDASR